MPITNAQKAAPHRVYSAEGRPAPTAPADRVEGSFLVAGLVLHLLGFLGVLLGRLFF